MAVSVKDYPTILRDTGTVMQGSASVPLNLNTGSVLRAVLETCASLSLWQQGQVLQLLQTTRLSTSGGGDVDTFIEDFGLLRVAAGSSEGNVTFSRFSTTGSAIVPINSLVQTADGTQQFAVIADPTNAAYSIAQLGYTLAAGVASVTALVIAINPGSGGNALAGTVTQLASAIPGIDTVTNPLPFTSGTDAESDQAARDRFVSFIASLSKATPTAIGNAIESVNPTIIYTLTENVDTAGNPTPGSFYVTIDDGTGSPPGSLISAVANAVDAVRAAGVTFAVVAPQIVTVTISMAIATSTGTNHSTAVTAVQDALVAYVNSLGLGVALTYSSLFLIARSVAGVTNATLVLLNGGVVDVAASSRQTIRATTSTVTVS